MNFWRLVAIVKYRKWMILGVVAVTLLVIAIAAPKPKVVYEATVYMSPTPQVMQGGVTVLTNNQTASIRNTDRNVILSNLIILAQGGEVYDKALDFLAQEVPEQRVRVKASLGSDLPIYQRVPRVEPSEGHILTYQDWNKDVLEVAPVRNASIGENGTTTDIIRITVRMPNGTVAPYLANAVGFAFAQTFQDKSREDTRQYASFLESSKTAARERLHKLQMDLAVYKQGHSVNSADAETQSAVSAAASLASSRDMAEAAVREAQAEMAAIDAQLAVQPAVNTQPLPPDMNPIVRKLREELAQAEADLRLVAQKYKPAHDTYKLAEARVNVLKDRLAKEGASYSESSVNNIRQQLLSKQSETRISLQSAQARLAAVNASLARATAKVNSLTVAQPGLAELMVERQQAEDAYRMLSQKYAEALIAEKEFTRTGSIVPYDWSRAAVGPVVQGPSRRQLLIYGLVLSLILGVVVAVWLDSIDQRMRNADDVERLLELPVIGLTPRLEGQDGKLPKLTHLYPLSATAESYKILRTNLLFEMRDRPFKTLMVATGRPGQGATTTVCNLAIALAQIGKKIILIDADMRRPSLHRFFELPNEVGLSTVLSGQSPVTEAFCQTDIENLVVVPAGPQPLNPSELLGSERMKRLVAQLEEHCDLVLFDSPSTVVFSDGPMLASWIDAVIMVVSANLVPRGTETQTRDLLRRARANILGVVVNRMAADNIDSCYFYDHYYASSIPQPGALPALESGDNVEPRKARRVARAIPEHADEPKQEQEVIENPFPD